MNQRLYRVYAHSLGVRLLLEQAPVDEVVHPPDRELDGGRVGGQGSVDQQAGQAVDRRPGGNLRAGPAFGVQ